MRRLYVDLETYSDAPIAKVGAYRYTLDDSTRLLLLAYAWDDAPARLVDIAHGEPIPADVLAGLEDPRVQKWAHNANFERAVLRALRGLDCAPDAWRCTSVWARSLALPAGLGPLARELKLDAQKLDPDKRLIRLFCTPQGATRRDPALDATAWAEFGAYCVRDVEVCRDVAQRLAPYALPEDEWRLWALDQRINDTGMPVDMAFVAAARDLDTDHRDRVLQQARAHTGMDNPRSRAQVLTWCAAQGQDLPDLRADTVTAALSHPDTPPSVRQALEHRAQLAATSTAKYSVMADMAHGGRVRGAYQYWGAERTGRWAGRGAQPHNLPRGRIEDVSDLAAAREIVQSGDYAWLQHLYGADVVGVLSSLVRTAFAAPEGYQLVVADYASIESVMLAWAAGSDYLLDLFRAGRDSYKDFATHLFGVPYAEVTKAQRKQAKPATLGCGYGLGAAGLQQYAAGFGQVLEVDQAQAQVRAYRQAYPEIPRLWSDLTAAVLDALRTGETVMLGARFAVVPDLPRFVHLVLPSRRSIAYYRPRIEPGDYGDQFTYAGREPGSRVQTHGGKLVENLVQAIARDVLAHGLMQAAQDPGLEIVGHVHDEILCLARDDDHTALDRLVAAMAPPPWCPDAPIKAVGWTGPWYRKD